MQKNMYNTFDIIKIPFKFAPKYASIIGIQKILDGVVPILQVLATAKFINTAINILNKEMSFNQILIPLTLVVLLIFYSWMSNQLIKFMEVKLEIRLRDTFRVNITEKRAKLKYRYIEDNYTWDLISRIAKEPEIQFKDAYMNFMSMTAMCIRAISLIVLLAINVWWSAIVMIIISVILFKVAVKNGEDSYEAQREVSKYRRKYEYYEDILTRRESAAERTLFQYTNDINEKWEQQFELARKTFYKTNLKNITRSRLRSILAAISAMIIVIILLKPLQMEVLSLGLFISLANALFEFSNMVSWQLTFYVNELAENKEYLKDMNEFFCLEEKEEALCKPSSENIELKSLEFKNVSFKYPNTEEYILKNLSFTIKEGGHYAFVGVNGAGKTTITKLITGLYENFKGEILINGKSIREYEESQLKALTSVVYQDFAKYYISFKDNISLGNINSMCEQHQNKNIENAIKIMELNDICENMPNGLETNLGKIKGGSVDLSGGQWQRVGMARSIMNDASLRILDEPTSSLDPISESNIYEQFEKLSKGNTTLFISHRLASTQIADEIFVIGNGTIIEKGSHQKLMEVDGFYAEMYKSQRSWYL
ncbi:ABC transporter ATP-binding protein [Clostridiaceae bacterium M8S5]|nr:ABC transporter ATP-binding protein [Clostridiaceae bacterium M8S5]